MAGKLRRLFQNDEILHAVESTDNLTDAARLLSTQRNVTVSRGAVKYWLRGLVEVVKKNGEPYIGTSVLDRKIRGELDLRERSVKDDRPTDESDSGAVDLGSIMVFGDIHAPYHHPDSLEFLKEVRDSYDIQTAICTGDEADYHALSFHDSDPGLNSAGAELEEARSYMRQLFDLFPRLRICHSNHGSLVYRRAIKYGIPVEFIKSYREILFPDGGGDGWSWEEEVDLGELMVQHQVKGSLMNSAAHTRTNLVVGHEHSKFELIYKANQDEMYWGAYAGCLVDPASLAFHYGKLLTHKPTLGCLVINEGLPILIPMRLGKDGRWRR